MQHLTQPSSGRWLFGWGDTAQERQILYRELQADVHACFPAHLCLCPSVWEAGGLRRVAQASSKKAHLPMEELVQARSLQNAVCTNTSAKSTFCLATPPEQGSVLLCNGQHLPTGSWCLFLLLFSIFWEVGHRGSCCDVCQRAFCLCSPLGVL